MVGSLFNMIASPSKSFTVSKSPVRTTSIPATLDSASNETVNLHTDHHGDDRRLLRPGLENQDTLTMYDDAEVDSEGNEANSAAFQCACKVWSCTQCNKAFNSARALKIHEVKQHENMPKRYIKCTHCDEVFDHGNLLQIHMKVHHNIKVQCPQCKDLPKPGNSKAPTDPVCPVCGVKFDHDKLLKLHMEHYHKVSRKEALTNEQKTFQPMSNLLSPNAQSPDAMTLSPDGRKGTPSPRHTEGRFPRPPFYENNDDSSARSSVSPRNDSRDHERSEMFPSERRFNSSLYRPRPLFGTFPRSPYYVPFNDGTLPHFGVVGYYPAQGVRRTIEKRPLGRSHSLPLKQEAMYSDVPLIPWQTPDTGHPMPYGMSRDKKVDRATLEAVRNSLKAKLRSVEETLLRDEAESHQPLSPTLQEHMEHQRYFKGRDDELTHPFRPSVITPRNSYGDFNLKRLAPPNDLEPHEKQRVLEKGGEPLRSPVRSPRSPGEPAPSFSPHAREAGLPGIYQPREIPKVSRDDLAIPNLQRELFDDQAKIFIKRGAPRCNRCQQTFCSKMEYLHHLISHKEKDGLIDASPEEMEFIEDVKRSMENKNLMIGDPLDTRQRTSATSSSGSPSLLSKNTLLPSERSGESNAERPLDEKSPPVSPSVPSSTAGTLVTETCVECKDVFADTTSYQSHIEKTHMKPRCRECGLTFDHKNLLKIHMDCYHSSLEVLQCYYCGMSFKQRGAFLDHVTSHESQDILKKKRVSEQNSEGGETGGRRRWGRLVASAQLPSEKVDLHDGERPLGDHLEARQVLALKAHTKQKLRKTVSLSAYTDMINRQKRSQAQFLNETRAKGDEVIGKEMRTRIFLPNFEDKMENLSRFASSSVQLAKKRVSPPPAAPLPRPSQPSPSQDGGEFRFRRHIPTPGQDSETSHYNIDPRPSYDLPSRDLSSDAKPLPYVHKKKLVRMKRSFPLDANDELRAAHLAFPLRKAFVRDEVESLYQMRHKKAFTNSDVTRTMSDPLDHRSALVKIERIEVEPLVPLRESKTPERKELSSPARHQTSSEPTATKDRHSPLKRVGKLMSNAVVPPPLIDVRRTQATTLSSTTVSDMGATSNRSQSPSTTTGKSVDYFKSDVSPSKSPVGELSDKNVKEKRNNSIKKLTKEALINSLSLKRRASAPDLYQLHHDQSTESTPEEKSKKMNYDGSPGSPSLGSERVDSPSADTKHHGSRSIYYTPRKQSDRDVTCTQCGVSFGHKKLYKIHLDSYHGKQQGHQCLQCGAKNFSNKDEFVKHLMAHQNDGNDDLPQQDSPRIDQESELNQTDNDLDNERLDEPRIRGVKASSREGSESAPSDEERSHNSPQPSSSEQTKSNEDSKANNNGQESTDKKTTCLLCGKTFENGKQLEQHFSSHAVINDDGRFCCVICNKAFETLRKLEVHSRSHTGFKPHKCEHCGRCFPYYSSYYYHKMTHTKDRPHKCPICGKGFIQTRYLRSHLATHKDENGSLSDEVESILRKAELNMNDETDEESIDSPSTAEYSPYTANDEETATAEILCSFKRGLNCSAQNSDSESASLS